jgi:pyruvate dehydrogenase E2 component (dihydrolipoamide acetyltransferase)
MIKEIRLPEISENVESGDIIDILVAVGDIVEEQQPIIEIETEKATFDMPSPIAGKVTEIDVAPDQNIKVGQVILKVDTDIQATEEQPPLAEDKFAKQQPVEALEEITQEIVTEKPSTPKTIVQAAPSVRQLARELGIDINKVPATGSSGRISLDDVKKYAKTIIDGKDTTAAKSLPKLLPDFTKFGDIERKPLTITRKKIAENVSYSWSNVPQVTQYDKADITDLQKFRTQYSEKTAQAGGKLTITSIVLKVVASALKAFPEFNASLDTINEQIILKKYTNIGIAVDTDRGLLVPVVRDVDKKSILQLSVELTELAEKVRNKTITPEEMMGGNFTVSNLGGIGGTHFSPIIYWPQAAILGLSRAREEPAVKNGLVYPRLMLPLSLSYDHRIIDGADGIRFLLWIVHALEQPFLLAIGESAL